MKKISFTKLSAVVVIFIAAVLVCFSGRLIEDARRDKNYVCQMIGNGEYHVWTSGGWQWQGLGHIEEYNKTSQVNFSGFSDDEDAPRANYETLNLAGGTIAKTTFADNGKGIIVGSFRVMLPNDYDNMTKIQEQYHNEHRLLNEYAKGQLVKAVTASGPLMTSLQSVSEAKTQLYEYITDQMNYGVYETTSEKITVKNDITGEDEIITVNKRVPDTSAGANGWKRKETGFSKYGIIADNLVIADILYDGVTQDQIDAQKSANLAVITAKTKAVEAQQKTIQIEEQGKQEAAQAKWAQEKIKAQAIAEAEQEREVSRLAAEKAEFDKKRIIAEGEAKARANDAIVRAGLTPQEKAEWDYKTAVGIAQALADSKVSWVPEIMFNGNGNNNNSAMDAVGLNMMLDVVKKMNSK